MTEPTDMELLALIDKHLGFKPRRDDTVIDPRTGRFHDVQRYRDLKADILAKWGTPPAVAGEPVAWTTGLNWRTDTRCQSEMAVKLTRKSQPEYGFTQPLYTHPSSPEGMAGGWIALPGTLPKPGTPVLLDIGKKYPIRAMWAAKHTVQAADDDTDWGEYVEEDDMYYAPEGWYEWNEYEEIHWAVGTTPCAWAPLTPTTTAGSGKGE